MLVDGRRSAPRMPRQLRARIQGTACFTVDVAEGGIGVSSTSVLPPGTFVDGVVEVDGSERSFSGIVAWARAGDTRMGGLGFGRMGIRFTAAPGAPRCPRA